MASEYTLSNDNRDSSLGYEQTERSKPADLERSAIHDRRQNDMESLHQIHSNTHNSVLSRVLSGPQTLAKNKLPTMGGGKDYPPLLGDRDPYKVEFDGPTDPELPTNWPLRRKLLVCGCLAYATTVISWGSAAYAPAIIEIRQRFRVGESVAALGISVYVFGFAVGPIVWGPLSEIYGRKLPMVVAYILFTSFVFGSAVAKDFQTLIITRFFAGATGSAPLTIAAAAFADMFTTESRGVAITLFSLCVIGGPMISPVVNGYIAASYLRWRWTEYLTGIMGGAALAALVLFQRESYAPVILVNKARELRKRTGNWGIYAPHETVELSLKMVVHDSLLRPVVYLFTEPILFLLTLYNGYVYGLLYMCLEAIPIIFSGYGWKGGNVMLPYLGLFVGCTVSNLVNIFYFEPKFLRDLKKSGKKVHPEARLPFMMASSVFFSIGIFWLCWTGAYPKHVHWLAPVFGAGVFGFGFIGLFIPVINYVIDTYLMLAASALAANTFLRSAMGAAFPLFTSQMFNNLGVQWAGTLTGCLSVIMLPVPFLFYKYGPWLRAKSRYAINLEDVRKQVVKDEEELGDEL